MTSSQAYSRPARLLKFVSWIIALLFAVSLNMLGSLVIRDMAFAPQGGPPGEAEFIDAKAEQPLQEQVRKLKHEHEALAEKVETIATALNRAEKDYADAKENFRNWVETRKATGDSRQNEGVQERTRNLDQLQAAVVNLRRQQDALEDQERDIASRESQVDAQIAQLRTLADQRYNEAIRHYELSVFGWRLAFTLPILLLAVWLFIRFGKKRYWPFVYGFGLFALTAFFVELVPYLPSFGGYVRALVGIALTVFAGIYMLRAFQRYVERKRQEMLQSQSERAKTIVYEKAISAYQKKLCPSCDKPWNLGGDGATFCIHCGLKLFDTCDCGARNFAFFPFCNACGTARPGRDVSATTAETLPVGQSS